MTKKHKKNIQHIALIRGNYRDCRTPIALYILGPALRSVHMSDKNNFVVQYFLRKVNGDVTDDNQVAYISLLWVEISDYILT